MSEWFCYFVAILYCSVNVRITHALEWIEEEFSEPYQTYNNDVYTNDFLVKLRPNVIPVDHAEEVARRLGFDNHGKVTIFLSFK